MQRIRKIEKYVIANTINCHFIANLLILPFMHCINTYNSKQILNSNRCFIHSQWTTLRMDNSFHMVEKKKWKGGICFNLSINRITMMNNYLLKHSVPNFLITFVSIYGVCECLAKWEWENFSFSSIDLSEKPKWVRIIWFWHTFNENKRKLSLEGFRGVYYMYTVERKGKRERKS